jgi:hypothetical protein
VQKNKKDLELSKKALSEFTILIPWAIEGVQAAWRHPLALEMIRKK